MLENKLDNGSPCFIPPLFRTHHSLCLSSLSLSVLRMASSREYTFCDSIPHCSSVFYCELWLIESNTFMKSTVVTDIVTPHSRHFCSVNLTPTDGPAFGRIAGTLPGLPTARSQVLDTVCCTQALRTICTMLSRVFHISLFVDHFYANYSPYCCGAILLFQHFVEDLSYHLLRRLVTCALMSRARIPLLSLVLPF